MAYPRGKDKKPVCVGCANRKLGFHRDPRTRKRMNIVKRRQRYKLHKQREAARLKGDGPQSVSDESVA
ncbi:MAG: hypothetical protein HKN26_10550 [Acidimicrobiales bacterium]|nr:hypothetical protein [Acidimicrobiales bacterium]